MNTPSFLIQRNNQVMVDMRNLYEQSGFAPKHFPEWIGTRIERAHLDPGKDFQTFKHNNHIQYIMPVPVALGVLDTLPNNRTRSAKQLISETIKTLVGTEPVNTPTELFSTVVPAVSTSAPERGSNRLVGPVEIPIYQLEGRAAVNGLDLFKRWNEAEDRRFGGWIRYRIDKLGLVLGKHYVEYDVVPSPGHKRGFTGYILSLDAAISIADAEKKGLGKGLAKQLAEFRKELAKLRLSTKGSLSDFIGATPVNLAPVEPETPEAVDEDMTTDSGPQGIIFDHTVAGEEGSLTVAAVGSSTPAGSQVVTDTREQDPKSGFDSIGGTPIYDIPESEVNSHAESTQPATEETPQPEAPMPPASELLLKSAQLLLQMAHVLVEQERKIGETRQVVGQMVAINQQAAQQTLGLFAGNVEPPQQTLRSRIRQAVNDRCRVTGEDQDQVYAFIYNRLYYLYGINVNARERRKDETYLALCERTGALDKVYTIVTSDEFTAAIRNAPIQPKQPDQQS